MKNIYFDICAIALFALTLWICYSKRLVKGRAARFFVLFCVISLICAILDVWMEFTVNPLPITSEDVVLGTIISFTYKLLRNGCSALYIFYLFAITKTDFRARQVKWIIALSVPYAVLVITLLQNFFTHNVFIVTQETGYSRGPALYILYLIMLVYWLIGTGYCIYCRRYLAYRKWVALLSIYILTIISVLIQFLQETLMVEMFCTAIGLLMILLLVMRPEETIDSTVKLSSYEAYVNDLRNIIMTRQRFQIVVLNMINAVEVRTLIGDDKFNKYVSFLGTEMEKVCAEKHIDAELFFERPASLYLITRNVNADLRDMLVAFQKIVKKSIHDINKSVQVDAKVCIIRCPEDVDSFDEIINLGHQFIRLGAEDEVLYMASDLKKSADYDITIHIEEILHRAIAEGTLEMYYQPIYDVKTGRFRSAEALARIKDPIYGLVYPSVFIPAAEVSGLILIMGGVILEQVFKFISDYDLEKMGLSYIEINLSIAQCLQRDMSNNIKRLQKKYNVSPHQINFEITESLLGHLNTTLEKNVRDLFSMGYSFSLDDYGIGYSNIQRIRLLPLNIVKIDKSLVDDMFTNEGKAIIKNTVHMMQDINKKMVMEGVETVEAVDMCKELSCDYIQGYYYSHPLPEQEFVDFINQWNEKK